MPNASTKFPPNRRRRSNFYVDGYNLYYGILQYRPEWKWLNLGKFCQSLRSTDTVYVRYFTAIIDEDHAYSPARDRQQKLLEVLPTFPNVEIIPGKFTMRDSRCRAACREVFKEPKEKKTDVNIAVRIIDDCIKDTPDEIIVISSDSDLEPALEWVRKNYSDVLVTVYLPILPGVTSEPRHNHFYRSIGVECTELPCGRIPDTQFNTAVRVATDPVRFVQRPDEWVKGYVPSN